MTDAPKIEYDVTSSASSEDEHQHLTSITALTTLTAVVEVIDVTSSDTPNEEGRQTTIALMQQMTTQYCVLSSSDSDDGYNSVSTSRRDSGFDDNMAVHYSDLTAEDDYDDDSNEREAVIALIAAYNGLQSEADYMIAASSSEEGGEGTSHVTNVVTMAIRGLNGSPDAFCCKVKVARTGILSGYLYTKISTLFEQLSDNGIDIIGDYQQYSKFVDGLMYQCGRKPDIQVLIMIENARVLYRLDKIEDMKRLCKDALKRSSHTRNASYLRCRALYVLAGAYRKQKKNHKSEYCAQLALQESQFLERGEDTAQARYNLNRQEMETYGLLIATSGGNRNLLADFRHTVIEELLKCMDDYQREPSGLPNKQRRCYIRVAQILTGGFQKMRNLGFAVTLDDLDEVRRKLLYVREHLWRDVTHRTRCSYLMAEGDLARHESHVARDRGDVSVAMVSMALARDKFAEARDIAREHHFESERSECEIVLGQLEK